MPCPPPPPPFPLFPALHRAFASEHLYLERRAQADIQELTSAPARLCERRTPISASLTFPPPSLESRDGIRGHPERRFPAPFRYAGVAALHRIACASPRGRCDGAECVDERHGGHLHWHYPPQRGQRARRVRRIDAGAGFDWHVCVCPDLPFAAHSRTPLRACAAVHRRPIHRRCRSASGALQLRQPQEHAHDFAGSASSSPRSSLRYSVSQDTVSPSPLSPVLFSLLLLPPSQTPTSSNKLHSNRTRPRCVSRWPRAMHGNRCTHTHASVRACRAVTPSVHRTPRCSLWCARHRRRHLRLVSLVQKPLPSSPSPPYFPPPLCTTATPHRPVHQSPNSTSSIF